MTNQITLSSPEIAVVNGIAITTSLSIAEYFHKNHKHVLDKIRLIISECDDSYHQPNFRQVVRNVSGGDGAIRKMPMFELTRDAFVLIAMGFTGKKALQWKIEYINAFNKMEAELCNRPVSRTTTDQRTPLRDAVNMLVGKKGLMYPEAYSFIHQRFNVSSIDDLALEQLPEAIEYIHRLAIDGEFIPSESGKQRQEMWDLYYMSGIHDYFNFIYEVYKTQIRPALNAVDSPISFRLNDRFSDGSILIGKLKASLEKRAGCDMSQVRELLM